MPQTRSYTVLALAAILTASALGQAAPAPQTPNPPPGGAAGTPQGTPATTPQQPAAAPTQPAGTRRLPQASSQEEFDAYNAVRRVTTGPQAEAAAKAFVEKYPNSELRGPVYQGLMDAYQAGNNADKAIEMGRTALTYDPNNPVTLIVLANVLAERTRDTDLDRDQRYDEAVKYAQHGLQTVNTDLVVAADAPANKVQMLRQLLSSMAHAAIGFVELSRHNDAAAEQHLSQAAQLNTVQPDPMVYLRLAIALDHLSRYPEALQATNKVLQLSPNGAVADLARREKERLEKLAGGGMQPPASGTAPPAAPGANPPATPQPPATGNPPPADKPKR